MIKDNNENKYFSTYCCDDWNSQFFPVEDELSFIFNIHVLDEFV